MPGSNISNAAFDSINSTPSHRREELPLISQEGEGDAEASVTAAGQLKTFRKHFRDSLVAKCKAVEGKCVAESLVEYQSKRTWPGAIRMLPGDLVNLVAKQDGLPYYAAIMVTGTLLVLCMLCLEGATWLIAALPEGSISYGTIIIPPMVLGSLLFCVLGLLLYKPMWLFRCHIQGLHFLYVCDKLGTSEVADRGTMETVSVAYELNIPDVQLTQSSGDRSNSRGPTTVVYKVYETGEVSREAVATSTHT